MIMLRKVVLVEVRTADVLFLLYVPQIMYTERKIMGEITPLQTKFAQVHTVSQRVRDSHSHHSCSEEFSQISDTPPSTCQTNCQLTLSLSDSKKVLNSK